MTRRAAARYRRWRNRAARRCARDRVVPGYLTPIRAPMGAARWRLLVDAVATAQKLRRPFKFFRNGERLW